MSETISIGAVQFLNAWPLTEGLAETPGIDLREEMPSLLPSLLRGGEVDVALLPAIEYFRLAAERGERTRGGPCRFVALPVAAISSRGAIGSVRLFGFAELDEVRRVLLAPASRTSNAVARLLFARQWKASPHFVLPTEVGPSPTREPDAELVVGDAGLVAERPTALWKFDLGAEWEAFVHKPLVYAFWVARADVDVPAAVEALAAARDRGLAAREELAERAAERLEIPPEVARRYLLEQVRYDFGEQERRGLMTFYRMAAEEGLAPEGGRLRLAPAADASGP